jgi:hypothetical protein
VIAVRTAALATALAALFSAACTGLMPRLGSPPPEDPPEGAVDAAVSGEEQVLADLEQEEQVHEDPGELDQLISKLVAESPAAESPPVVPAPTADAGPSVPQAHENWAQTDEQCLARLTAAGIETSTPDFETPFVKAPLLLDGPIEGVEIRPRWPRSNRVNEVMDCRLVLALAEVARQVVAFGVEQILFYSTYRPLKPPPDKCKTGKAGASCRKAKRKYEKALKRKHSQHRKGLAIDIRWFVTAEGETIDVLEHYERHDKQPPCEDEPETDAGRFLKELACRLHELRTFHVILTPNSNKAHHNHFHFDITPDSTWYSIK